jgi:hypothetical protein
VQNCDIAKEFAVKFEVRESSVFKGRAQSVHFYVDGRRMNKKVLLPHDDCLTVRGVETSNNTMRRFMFADVRATGEEHPPFPTIPPS